MKNSTNSKSKRNIMAITILCILGVLSVAYAAFSTNLKISLKGATADNKWNIQFDHLPNNDTTSKPEIFTVQGTSSTATISAGTVDWGDGGGTEKVNIDITGLTFSNLDNEFYYVFAVKNSGTMEANLKTPPSFDLSEKEHEYYSGTGSDKTKYKVKYNATFFNAGDTQPISLEACKNLDTKLSSGLTLAPEATTYWVLKVYATCSIQSGDAINQLSSIPGNTTFTKADTLDFTVTPGTWESLAVEG